MDGNAGVLFSSAGNEGKDLEWARRHMVGRDYFETAGLTVLAGRGFRKEDEASGSMAVVVSQELVRRFWHGIDPLGSTSTSATMRRPGASARCPERSTIAPPYWEKDATCSESWAMAKDVSEDLVASKKHPAIYFPLHPADYAQPSLRGVTLMLRAVPGADVITAVRREISAMDSDLTPFNARSMAEQIVQFMSALRAASWTYGLIGVFGLILAGWVSRRRGVFGGSARPRDRHSYGARRAEARRTRPGHAGSRDADRRRHDRRLGVRLGWTPRVVRHIFLSGQRAKIRIAAPGVGAPLLTGGLGAGGYMPARQSMRVDPAVALRAE